MKFFEQAINAADSNNVCSMVEKIGFVSASSAQAVLEVASSGDKIREMTENIAIC